MKFFRFEDPWFLILFLIIPYLVWKRKEQGTISYSSLEILQNIAQYRLVFINNPSSLTPFCYISFKFWP
ncbi:MAG: hypothetical protein CM1200mP16_03310 [Nitrospina sp.]|nr:MAG: hypothetical protein CM1200mP16_03310 [Nitrospina sp.]